MSWDRTTTVALLVAGALFMENLDGTVIVTALPQMAETFGTKAVDLNVGISAYMLTLAVLIPASGWMTDRLGARSVFATAVALFTLASVLCGFSQGLLSFTAARILQGIGGAMMVPVGRLVVLRTTAKPDLMRAIALITWPALVAPILGPPVGGFITTTIGWRWIFFLNAPLGVIAFALTFWLIQPGHGPDKRPFDALGFLLTGVSCLGLMYGIDLVSQGGADSVRAVEVMAVSAVIGAVAVWHARRHPTPLVELWALRVQTFAVTAWGGSLFRIAINAVPFLLPLLFQLGFGLDPFTSGLLVLSVFAGNLAMKPGTSWVLRTFGFRTTLIGNGLIGAVALFATALIVPATPTWLILIILFIGGASRSMQFTAINTIAFADVPDPRMSGANTLFNMVQQISMGLGIAIGAVALRVGELFTPAHAKPPLLAFHIAFAAVGVIAVLGVLDSIALPRDAGAGVGGGLKRR